MKKITNLLLAFMVLAFAQNISAQNTCCSGSTVAPEVTSGVSGTAVPLDQNTPGLSVSTNASSELTTVEYLITKRGVAAISSITGVADTTGGGGDVVIGSVNNTGVFKPQDKSRYGISLTAGDTFDLTAVGYDLALIKVLGDSLLNGKTGTAPCCNLFATMAIILSQPALAGFCDSVNAAGVHGASDINSMEDVLVIFDAFSTGQVSVGSIIFTLNTINGSGTYISADCGGTGANNFLPYGINRNKKYGYVASAPVAVQKLSDVSLFMMFPNPVTNNVLNISLSTTQVADLSINVFNTVGKRVSSKVLGAVNGDMITTVDMNGFAPGMYLVELTDGQNSETYKLMVK